MKKFVVSTMALFSVIFILTGCGKKTDDKKAEETKTTQSSNKKAESKKPFAPKPAPKTNTTADYKSIEELQAAMDGDNEIVLAKTVTFVVDEIIPDGTFGYTFTGNEKVAFVSKNAPDIELKPGDTVTLKIKDQRDFFSSWIIEYEYLRKE